MTPLNTTEGRPRINTAEGRPRINTTEGRPRINTAEGRPRVSFLMALGLGAVLLTGCATVAHSGPDFRAMSSSEHLRAACDLEDRAKLLTKKFDRSAKAVLRPAIRTYRAPGMNVTSSPSLPEYYNPTYKYVVMARDLRHKATRHLAAAGQGATLDREVCSQEDSPSISYGLNWFFW